MRKGLGFLIVTLVVLLMPGCYVSHAVPENQIGVELPNGVTIGKVVGSGRYSDGGVRSKIVNIDVSAKQISWDDPDLVTKDLQPIGVTLQVTYARDRADKAIRLMWDQYHQEATDDKALETMVRGRIPAVAKEVTTRYTLPDLLGTNGNDQAGRALVAQQMGQLLTDQFTAIGVTLLNVSITNIEPDQAYLDLLNQKAQVGLQTEIAQQKTAQLQEQLKQEQAQSQVAYEIANRNAKTTTTELNPYIASPLAAQVREAELIAEALKNCTSFCNMPPNGLTPAVAVPTPTP